MKKKKTLKIADLEPIKRADSKKINALKRGLASGKKKEIQLLHNMMVTAEDGDVKSWWTTGSQTMDDILSGETDDDGHTIEGTGNGFPGGRWVEIFGMESVSKTSLVLSTIAQAQKRGEIAAFVDVEHALSRSYAEKLGVNWEDLLRFEPNTAEDTVSVVKWCLSKKEISVVGVDSLDAMIPKAMFDDPGSSGMGLQPRIIGKMYRTLVPRAKENNTLVLAVNQVRSTMAMFGPSDTTSGGNAPKFYSSIRLSLKKETILTAGTGVRQRKIGIRIRAETVKNKVATPFREAAFDIIWNKGMTVPSKEKVLKDRAERRARFAKK